MAQDQAIWRAHLIRLHGIHLVRRRIYSAINICLYKDGYNAGLVLWYSEKATQEKWDALWKPVFDRVNKPAVNLNAAEQVNLNLFFKLGQLSSPSGVDCSK